MQGAKVYRLMITPQTKVNISDNEKWMLSPKITNEYLLDVGKNVRRRQIEEGTVKKVIKETYFVNRKRYMMTYFDYKRKAKQLFDESGLGEFPVSNAYFKFYLPMPKSWSARKKRLHSFEPHQQVPDASNLHKAIEDACSKKDRCNWDYRASKFWCDMSTGYIEIHVNALPEAKGYMQVKWEDNKFI